MYLCAVPFNSTGAVSGSLNIFDGADATLDNFPAAFAADSIYGDDNPFKKSNGLVMPFTLKNLSVATADKSGATDYGY